MSFSLEPLLDDSLSRFVLFPIQHSDLWKIYKDSLCGVWAVEAIDLSDDLAKWPSISDHGRECLERFLTTRFLLQAYVLAGCSQALCSSIKITEARYFLGTESVKENISFELFSLLLTTFIKDSTQRGIVLGDNIPYLTPKVQWVDENFNDRDLGFALKLIGYVCIDVIFTAGAFAFVQNQAVKDLLPGVSDALTRINVDSERRAAFIALLLGKLYEKPRDKEIKNMIVHATRVELAFVEDALMHPLAHNVAQELTQYVKYVADGLLLVLGQRREYYAANPFAGQGSEAARAWGSVPYPDKTRSRMLYCSLTHSNDPLDDFGDE